MAAETDAAADEDGDDPMHEQYFSYYLPFCPTFSDIYLEVLPGAN